MSEVKCKFKEAVMENKLGEECGVFGIYDNDGLDCSKLTYLGLFALQHRGQESCGIVTNDNRVITYHKDQGRVGDVFNETNLSELQGSMAVGHVRYSTTGQSNKQNAQPLVTRYIKGTLVISHNGNLTNSEALRSKLEADGAVFQSTTDSEVIAHLIARQRLKTGTVEDAVAAVMDDIKGAYSMVIMSPKKLIAARDPFGFRPLCLGMIDNSYVIASETCALDTVGAKFIRDIEPGEVIVINEDGLRTVCNKKAEKTSLCIFEYIYFARSDSKIDGMGVYEAKKLAGKILAQSHPVEADLVIGVPDSGLDAAIGYSEESGIPYGRGLVVNRYIGRTFIKPQQSEREASVKIKLNALKDSVKDKRIVMVDDSIVRGTTCANLVKMLKEAGAKEVHMRISSPPFLWPCYFGTDVPDREHLVAVNNSLDAICEMIGADSLGYLPVERVHEIAPDANLDFCDACFTGHYPYDVNED